MFNKILIANRGEIAVRVIKTAHAQGYATVAVFSEADKDAPHVKLADEAVYIGAANAATSYLDSEKIIKAAKSTGADAIHPGYGFLSENAAFCQRCQEENIIFIGPNSDAIALMGSKREAKLKMLAAGVPCIPGYEGSEQSNDKLLAAARLIGFPLMIKASAGGGGRGMRLVAAPHQDDTTNKDTHINTPEVADETILQALQSARSEALSAFGSGELILEKALFGARHIEIQIMADQQGNTIHLGERDCSMQRRHQKVIEESPSMSVTQALRERMGSAAVMAAKACNYVGAGTVEFLLANNGEFFFLEMNTRLQVEHPVTEWVTGLDLVSLQLSIANGEQLSIKQTDVELNGHAIEVRLYAEDPANSFLPQAGKVLAWQPAISDNNVENSVSGLRIDSGIEQGQEISAYYDPMLAKFIAYGDNREQARRRLIRLVNGTTLLGMRDNRAFLTQLLNHECFINGQATTDFIANKFQDNESLNPQKISNEEKAIAALLCNLNLASTNERLKNNTGADFNSSCSSFHSSYIGEQTLKLKCFDDTFTISITKPERADINGLSSKGANESPNEDTDELSQSIYKIKSITNDKAWQLQISLLSIAPIKGTLQSLRYALNGVVKTMNFVIDHTNSMNVPTLWLDSEKGNISFENITLTSTADKQTKGNDSNDARSPMAGAVIDVLVKPGDRVKTGDSLVVIEAMKMEHVIKAQTDSIVEEINVQVGDQVKGRQLLVKLEK